MRGCFRDVYVAKEDSLNAQQDDEVVVEVTVWPNLRRNPEGVVRKVLGKAGDPAVDVQSVILEFGLPREFSAEVQQAAEKITAQLPKSELSYRRDLREHTTVTIDPVDAKDFDDALSLYHDPKTGRLVGARRTSPTSPTTWRRTARWTQRPAARQQRLPG